MNHPAIGVPPNDIAMKPTLADPSDIWEVLAPSFRRRRQRCHLGLGRGRPCSWPPRLLSLRCGTVIGTIIVISKGWKGVPYSYAHSNLVIFFEGQWVDLKSCFSGGQMDRMVGRKTIRTWMQSVWDPEWSMPEMGVAPNCAPHGHTEKQSIILSTIHLDPSKRSKRGYLGGGYKPGKAP